MVYTSVSNVSHETYVGLLQQGDKCHESNAEECRVQNEVWPSKRWNIFIQTKRPNGFFFQFEIINPLTAGAAYIRVFIFY